MLLKSSWSVLVEPAIPTPEGIRRPDIIVWNADKAYVIDVTIVADNADMYVAHELKVAYYNKPHVTSWVSHVSGRSSIVYSSVAFNWRGALAPPSYELLHSDLKITKRNITLLSVIVLERSFHIWLTFKRGTYREGIGEHWPLHERDGIG